MKAYIIKFLQLANKATLCPLVRSGPQQTVVVDFSSPNIAKPFHLGHFRATVTGNFIRNVNEAMNHKVVAINYLGDWGTQFGILAKAFTEYGSMEKIHSDPIRHLQEIYVQANRSQASVRSLTTTLSPNTLASDTDPKQMEWWRLVRQLTIEHLTQTYARMNVQFTAYEYESDYVDAAKQLVTRLLAAGLAAHDSDGVVSFRCPKSSTSDPRIVLLKSDASTLYLTRDIAAALSRYERYQFDRIHYVVEGAQRLHFQHLCTVLQYLGCPWLEPQTADASLAAHPISNIHVPFGRVQGASTRHGQGLTLADILDNARNAIIRRMKKSPTTRVLCSDANLSDSRMTPALDVADQLGVTCLVIEMLRKRRQKPIHLHCFLGSPVVNRSDSVTTGDRPGDAEEPRDQSDLSGLGLQYCYARLCSLETQCIRAGILQTDSSVPHGHDADHFFHRINQLPASTWEITSKPAAFYDLYEHMLQFESVLHSAYLDYEASVLVQYATRLTTKINVAWKQLPVITCSDHNEKILRLALFLAARNVLEACLRLLGIQPLRSI